MNHANDSVSVVTPNPKTSGNGCHFYLAMWGSAIKSGGDAASVRDLEKRSQKKQFGDGGVYDQITLVSRK